MILIILKVSFPKEQKKYLESLFYILFQFIQFSDLNKLFTFKLHFLTIKNLSLEKKNILLLLVIHFF